MTAGDRGAHLRLAGRAPGTLSRPPVPNTAPYTPGPELSGGGGGAGAGGGSSGRPGGGRGAWWQKGWGGADTERGGAGRGRPPRFVHAGRGTGPSESPDGDLASMCKRNTEDRPVSEALPTRRAGPGAQTVLDGAPRTARAGPHLPTDWDSGSRRGVSQSRVRRPRPTRARRRVERALPGHPRKQGPVHPRLRTRQDFDKEKAWVPGDGSGDRTPRGGPHTRLPRSALGSPPPERDAENTSGRKDPRARTQARPPATSKPPSGPVPTSGAGPRAKHTLLRAAQEESGPPSPSPGAPGREDPLPAHRGGPAQVGSGRSVSAAAGARGDAGRPGQAAPQAGCGAPRRSPSSET